LITIGAEVPVSPFDGSPFLADQTTLPVLAVESDQRGVRLVQEDLPVRVRQATVHRVAAHHRHDVRILFGLVFPKDLAVAVQIQRKDRIRERAMDVQHIADHERPAFVSAQDAGRERPCHLQLAGIVRVDPLEL
jgi:hypothetical protein